MAITGSSAPGDGDAVAASKTAWRTWACAPSKVGADSVSLNSWRSLAVAAPLNCASLACCSAPASVIAVCMPGVNPVLLRPIRKFDCAAVMSACCSDASSFMAETRLARRTASASVESLLPTATWSFNVSRVLIPLVYSWITCRGAS